MLEMRLDNLAHPMNRMHVNMQQIIQVLYQE